MHFTPSHEWIEVKGDTARVGITEHAQQELGDIVYVELPKEGKSVKQGVEVAVLESTKAAADVYAPVGGTIVAVNQTLKEQPELINQDAEHKGWLYDMKISDPKELDHLLSFEEYQNSIQG